MTKEEFDITLKKFNDVFTKEEQDEIVSKFLMGDFSFLMNVYNKVYGKNNTEVKDGCIKL